MQFPGADARGRRGPGSTLPLLCPERKRSGLFDNQNVVDSSGMGASQPIHGS